jgi:2-haloacid dehalogenase
MITTIIFDLGGVLIDWNPRHLYKQLFTDEAEMEHFLANITTSDWNEEQDGGRSLQEGTDWLVQKHPEHEANIRAFYGRWDEMLGDALQDTLEIFKKLKASNKYKIYALTNWSAETFGIAKDRFEFLNWFDGIVVSGDEKTRKPNADFYQILLNRYHVNPAESLFIDDNYRNILAAQELGIKAIHFTSATDLAKQLSDYGVVI